MKALDIIIFGIALAMEIVLVTVLVTWVSIMIREYCDSKK